MPQPPHCYTFHGISHGNRIPLGSDTAPYGPHRGHRTWGQHSAGSRLSHGSGGSEGLLTERVRSCSRCVLLLLLLLLLTLG
uniref:Uncharacterized protein n=1 Tax=Knipowitschia caucasica TaxID=637954 RepID=A0AAV2L4B2_KNICA